MDKAFLAMKNSIGAEVQDTTAAFATIIGRFINRRYFQILRAVNWKNLNDDYSFATVDGTQNYALPEDFGKEIACHDVTNSLQLAHYDLDELYRLYGNDLTTEGSVERYVIYEDAVKAQPSAASVLALVSDSASDTAVTVLIRGVADGAEDYETVTLTGTTPVSTTKSYTTVKAVSKSTESVGKVTITSNAGAVTLAIISREYLKTRYKMIKLHYVPTGVATINIPYIIKPLPLSQNYDYAVIDCADLIELGALADCWRFKRQFGKAQTMELMFNQELQEYIFDKFNEPNQVNQFLPTTYDKDSLY